MHRFLSISLLPFTLGYLILLSPSSISAQDDGDDGAGLATQLANPISSLISLPIQANYDEGFGPTNEGSIWRFNIQPVIPTSLNDDWNLISRTILPVISQHDVLGPGQYEFGLGDALQSLFFSPVKPTEGGWIWGAGPALLIPTATADSLGGEKWGIGPTGIALRQEGPWTYGFLANHLSSFAGEDGAMDLNATFLQPFVSYITKTQTTFAINTESTYDHETDLWSIPINFTVSQLLTIGEQPIQLQGGVRYWAESPDAGVTLLFPAGS